MPTLYPDGPDDFRVTSLPEDTPLSQAGPGADRNHPELHQDEGDAIEALQLYAAQKTHDHSGDDDDPKKGPRLKQANTHEEVDTDLSPASIHHTTGTGANQAATGDHTHDYPGNTILRKPFEQCTSTQRPAPTPGKVIWEVDTNRMRVWAQFPGQRTAVQGLYSIDKLERTSVLDLGNQWQQTYLPSAAGSGHGRMATPDGNAASWIAQGGDTNRCIARRINAADAHTQSNDQVITFNTNESVADWAQANSDAPTTNDAYFRMSDDGQTYVRAALTWYKGSTGAIMLAYTTTGPTGEQLLGQLAAKTNTPNILWQLRLVGNKFEVYMGLEYVGSIVDPNNYVSNGFKGWGFGMAAGDGGSVQDIPNEISEVGIADATYFTTSALWQLLPVGDMPKVGLAAGHAQAINPTGTMIEWDIVEEDNFGYWRASDKSSLIVTEPGIYHIHASIAWGTQLTGDRAATILMINNQPTPHMHWEFVRGYNYAPGFSQTVDVSAYVRLDANDRVGVACAHNGNGPQFTGYKKNVQITQLSRFFMVFHSA